MKTSFILESADSQLVNLSHHSCFYTGGKFLDVIYFLLGTINITILPEVTTVGLKPDDVPNLTQRVHSIMENEYEK